MVTRPRLYSDEERKERLRACRKRWEEKNPEKVLARTMASRERAKAKRAGARTDPMRTCVKCGTTRPIEEFKRHGERGRKTVCMVCEPISQNPSHKRQKEWAARNPEKVLESKRKSAAKAKKKELPHFVKVKADPKTKPARESWSNTLEQQGWRKVFGESDPSETLMVFARGMILMFYKNYVGSYSTGKHSYALIGDDTGKRYKTLGHAEAAARRMA